MPLGTLHYICKESDQYCLQVRTKNNLVCNSEMNFKQKNLEVRCIQKYLRRSAKNECPLEIIIGNSFVKRFETANFQSKDCNVYALVRSQKQKKNSKDKKPKKEFKLIKCFDSNNLNLDSTTSVDTKKNVILISLNEINPAFTKRRLMNPGGLVTARPLGELASVPRGSSEGPGLLVGRESWRGPVVMECTGSCPVHSHPATNILSGVGGLAAQELATLGGSGLGVPVAVALFSAMSCRSSSTPSNILLFFFPPFIYWLVMNSSTILGK